MTDSPPQTTTLPLLTIEGVTIAFHGVDYLHSEKMPDLVTISQALVRAVMPLASLYSTVGVLRQVKPYKLPVYINGWVVYPISSLTMSDLCAKLIISATPQWLKLLESFAISSSSDNIHGMQILGLVLTFTIEQPAWTEVGCTACASAFTLAFSG